MCVWSLNSGTNGLRQCCARKAFACACVVPPLFSMISLIPGHDTNIPEVVTPGVENEKEQKEEDVILAANAKYFAKTNVVQLIMDCLHIAAVCMKTTNLVSLTVAV